MSSESPRPTGRAARDECVLLVLAAPSGSGKTTLAHRLVNGTPGAVFSVSCTTRAPRGNERDGVDYTFVDEATFRRMVDEDRFAEWAQVHGNFYGTPRSVVEDAKAHGRLALFDIDVQGGEQIKARYPEAVTVLIVPPSFAELERRLRSRGTDAPAVIERRLLAARSEVQRARYFDFVVVNDQLDEALADLQSIVRAERSRARRIDTAGLGF